MAILARVGRTALILGNALGVAIETGADNAALARKKGEGCDERDGTEHDPVSLSILKVAHLVRELHVIVVRVPQSLTIELHQVLAVLLFDLHINEDENDKVADAPESEPDKDDHDE